MHPIYSRFACPATVQLPFAARLTVASLKYLPPPIAADCNTLRAPPPIAADCNTLRFIVPGLQRGLT